jgi:hypothetical protein
VFQRRWWNQQRCWTSNDDDPSDGDKINKTHEYIDDPVDSLKVPRARLRLLRRKLTISINRLTLMMSIKCWLWIQVCGGEAARVILPAGRAYSRLSPVSMILLVSMWWWEFWSSFALIVKHWDEVMQDHSC